MLTQFLKKIFFKNEQGMSIAEVLVAAGMLGVISLGVSQLMSNMSKSMRWSESKSEEISLLNRFRMEVRDKLVCTHTLVGFCTSGGAVGAFSTQDACLSGGGVWTARNVLLGGPPLTQIFSRNNTPLLEVGDEIGTGSGRVRIEALEFQQDPGTPPVANTQGSAFLSIRLTRLGIPGTDAGMSRQITDRIPLVVVWGSPATTITECYADRENTILTAKDEACQNIGGVFDQADENRCRLLAKGDVPLPGSPPTSGYPALSETDVDLRRAVTQQYVTQTLKESCRGPGMVYQPPVGANMTPRCLVDSSALTAQCPAGMVARSVSFNTVPSGLVGDAETLNNQTQLECVAACQPHQIFSHWDPGTGNPVCRSCAAGHMLMWNDGAAAPVCRRPWRNGNECENEVNDNVTYIRIFDGRNDLSGAPICRTIQTYNNTECASMGGNKVMIGIDFTTVDGNSTARPRCCELGTGCPAPAGLCANGFDGIRDSCGFLCPGNRLATSIPTGQPIVYGCTSEGDSLLTTNFFYNRVCGGDSSVETPAATRFCFLGGDMNNHSFMACRAISGRVRFFSKAVGEFAQDQSAGQEVDSYCLIPQVDNNQTYGRGVNKMVEDCVSDGTCPDVKTLNDVAINAARVCPAGWNQALSSEGKFVYEVLPTSCDCKNFKHWPSFCIMDQHHACESTSIAAGMYFSAPGGPTPANWPHSFKNASADFYDTLTRTIAGECVTNDPCETTPMSNPMIDPICPDSPAKQSFKCYARIGGISCK